MKNLFEMIEMGELVGAESYLHINYQNQIIIIRVNGTTDKKMGDKIAVYLDAQRIHLFDIDTEMRI